jgi:nicotinamide riboside kinase
MKENIITDRTIYDVMAFTFSAESISDVEKREFANLVSRFSREYDVVIYVSPEGVEIEDNGIRTIDAKYRDSIDNAIKLMLNEWPPVKLIEIKGTTEERIETIKGALFS